MGHKEEIFNEIWNGHGDVLEKVKRIIGELGEDAGRVAEKEKAIPFSLFQRAGVVGPDESLIIPGGEFYVPFDVKVEPGGELAVSPGTVLRFAPGTGVVCYGLLRIIGNRDKRIRLVPADEDQGWAGVRIEGPETWGSILSLCEISGARGIVYPEEEASFGGGLIIADTKIIKIHNCHIKNSVADYGGGMMAAGVVDLEIVGNTFMDCSGRVGAGIALAECAGVVLESNKIYKNKAETPASTGAGAMITDSQNIVLLKNDIRGCSAGAGAGMMLVDCQKVFLEENLFFQNSTMGEAAGNGGGLAMAGSRNVEVVKCRFLGNAGDNGGGMVIMRSTDVRVADSILAENTAAGSEESGGGGIFVGDVSGLRLERNRLENNMATVGGGFSVLYSPGFVAVGNVASGNMARVGGGGATVFECNNATLDDNEFSANTSPQGAGLLVNACNRIKIKGNRFRANQTGPKENSTGGALVVVNSKRPVISDNEFRENISVIAGAVMISSSKNSVLRSNRFLANSGVAGIIAVADSEGVKIERNFFRGNELMTEDIILQSESEVSESGNTYEE